MKADELTFNTAMHQSAFLSSTLQLEMRLHVPVKLTEINRDSYCEEEHDWGVASVVASYCGTPTHLAS